MTVCSLWYWNVFVLLFVSNIVKIKPYKVPQPLPQAYIPPPLPLSPFPEVRPEELQEYASEVLEVLEEATLPTQPAELVAIILSEAVAGFTGGISERLAALAVGDKDGFQNNIKGTTTGTYFAFRGAVRSIASIVGLPTAVSQLIADISASAFAESLKFIERNSEENKGQLYFDDDRRIIESSSDRKQRDKPNKIALPVASIVQDVSKWVAYDLLLPSSYNDIVPIHIALGYGALSGLISHSVYEILSALNGNSTNAGVKKARLKEFLQAMIEAGVLFATYESSLSWFETSTTPQIQSFFLKKFTDFKLYNQ